MEQIIDQLVANFDFTYMLVINVLTYMLIKFVDHINGEKPVSVLHKRILLLLSIGIVFIIYILIGYDNKLVLINSSIVAPVAWSWILRPIIKHLGGGYR